MRVSVALKYVRQFKGDAEHLAKSNKDEVERLQAKLDSIIEDHRKLQEKEQNDLFPEAKKAPLKECVTSFDDDGDTTV